MDMSCGVIDCMGGDLFVGGVVMQVITEGQ